MKPQDEKLLVETIRDIVALQKKDIENLERILTSVGELVKVIKILDARVKVLERR